MRESVYPGVKYVTSSRAEKFCSFIVGYNYQRGSLVLPSDLGNEFFAKFSYLLHF